MNKIKDYELIRQIGTGGFSDVFLAWQESANREVAIKVISPLYTNCDDFARRLQCEVELVMKSKHPNVIPIYDYWCDEDGAFIVMPYIKGENLAEKLLTGGALDMQSAVHLLEQVARALHSVHQNNVVHQDIKPANILLGEDGNVYLIDFGIASDIERNVNLAIADSGNLYGSLEYISPERLRRRKITHRSDIYSLGLIMYEVLTGEAPFQHEDNSQLLRMHICEDLPSLQTIKPNLPENLNDSLQQATCKNPTARYASVIDFARDFISTVINLGIGHTNSQTTAVYAQV